MDDPETLAETRALRIFVVEDDPEMHRAYKFYFESRGHTVSAAFSVAYARERLAVKPYDLLIVDIGLTDGDGWELMNTVKLFRPLYAVAITARDTESDRAKSAAAGFRRHLVKPWHVADLDATLVEAALLARDAGADDGPGIG